MKTLLHISSSHSRYVYHRQWGGTGKSLEVGQGTVGAEQQDVEEAAQIWNELNKRAENGMAEVRAAIMVPVEKAQDKTTIAPYAWEHKRR